MGDTKKKPFKKIDVMLLADELTYSLDEVVKGLRLAEEPVFQMNGRLVTLLHHNAPPPEESEVRMEELFQTPPTRRPAGALILHDVNEVLLTEIIGRVARFHSFDHRASAPRGMDPSKKGAWKPTRTPPDFGRHILARGQWALRILRGTVEAPTLRPDGTVVQKEGYDTASGLYLDLNGTPFPPVPDAPSREDALEALALLTDLISTFPFVPGEGEEWGGPTAARSVALSAMLTAVVRRSIATAPAHAIVAPTPGTGKTKLSEIASVMATGRTPTAISYGKTQEEFEKRLFAVLLAGDPVVLIDNVEADEVASDEFCTVLTSEEVKNRILGVSRMAKVATNSLFLVNGNNVVFRGDIVDRVVIANLDAKMEDPKKRVFEREPVSYAMEHRSELVVAALTILRAHALAGSPGVSGLTPSRFPSWDKVVRGALVWLGEPDPQLTRDHLAVSDPVRDTHAAVLHAMKEAVGLGVRVGAQDLIDRAGADDAEAAKAFAWPPNVPWPEDAAADLQTALSNAVDGRVLSSKRVGRYLTKFAGRVFDGLVLRARGDTKRGSSFWLEESS